MSGIFLSKLWRKVRLAGPSFSRGLGARAGSSELPSGNGRSLSGTARLMVVIALPPFLMPTVAAFSILEGLQQYGVGCAGRATCCELCIKSFLKKIGNDVLKLLYFPCLIE